MIYPVTFRIREVRKSKGITLDQLSELTFISKTELSDIERGKKMPGFDKMLAIRSALGVDLESLYECK